MSSSVYEIYRMNSEEARKCNANDEENASHGTQEASGLPPVLSAWEISWGLVGRGGRERQLKERKKQIFPPRFLLFRYRFVSLAGQRQIPMRWRLGGRPSTHLAFISAESLLRLFIS